MKKIGRIAILLQLLFSGCMGDSDEVGNLAVMNKVDDCLSMVTNACPASEYQRALRELVDTIANATNSSSGIEAANKLADRVLKIDLRLCGEEYARMENRIERYVLCSGAAAKLLLAVDGEERWLDFFVASGDKLKEACFSIPIERGDDKLSRSALFRRRALAMNLRNLYEREVNLWRFYKGRGEKALIERRETFVNRTRHLFEYPGLGMERNTKPRDNPALKRSKMQY